MKITKAEDKFITGIKANIWWFVLIVATFAAVGMRLSGRDFISRDAEAFLLPWFEQIKNLGGFSALKQQVGNYNIPYQICIALMTYLPIQPLYQYKLFSVLFDFILAVGAAALVYACCEKNKSVKACIAYAVTLCLPTVVFNSSVWAQCDSIFTAFAVWSLYFLRKERYTAAFSFFGLAFAFKLQAIFILPVYVIYYFITKKFSILHFLQIPAVGFLLSLPAVFMGRNVSDIWMVYVQQTDTYQNMFLNYPSFYAIVGDDYATLKTFAICLFFVVMFLAFLYFCKHFCRLEHMPFLELCVWSVWCCVLLLPAMHERYAFAADVLSVALALYNKKYTWVCIFINITSLIVYSVYLFNYTAIGLGLLAVLNTVAFVYFSYCIFIAKTAPAVREEQNKTGCESCE